MSIYMYVRKCRQSTSGRKLRSMCIDDNASYYYYYYRVLQCASIIIIIIVC